MSPVLALPPLPSSDAWSHVNFLTTTIGTFLCCAARSPDSPFFPFRHDDRRDELGAAAAARCRRLPVPLWSRECPRRRCHVIADLVPFPSPTFPTFHGPIAPIAPALALLRAPKTPPPLSMVDKKMEENIAQFCGVTGASCVLFPPPIVVADSDGARVKDARRFLEKYKRMDAAVDAYYGDPDAIPASPPPQSHFVRPASGASSTARLNGLFDKYKDADGEQITVDGTIRMCEDLSVDPEDVVLLAVAFELKSPRMGEWSRAGYVDGWKALGADSIPAMQAALSRLRTRLTSGDDPEYFQKVYNNTFEFAKSEGQRSIPLETATALWGLLLPYATLGGRVDDHGDTLMDGDGWRPEYNDWWSEFLTEKRSKGVSKDTWIMFLDFVRSIDARFATYDVDAAWPSSIDDFVEWAKERLGPA
ncbi:Defective in cullin neddylation protein [Mycena indigotica]|uniref:Defective in cullin neddylation protein n=1 Tax=Mycena indigotica TaxID=2126181 RepID=A0A8H6WCZ8_9AGAR|nr:Defective in cullin neddylation protein [Mycena indigotica]KAF7310278.1 Defective in cullin neddylation protein [Mycena indigotica]